MEDPNSTLLPYILETLSRTPELCDTFENLCKNVHEQLIQEQNGRYANVRLAIQRALNVGQSLGIITLNNETIRVPFNFRQNKNYRNLAHFTLNATPGGNTAELIGTTQQQQKQNQNQNQQNKSGTPQKKEPAPKQKTQKELEEEKQHAKYIKQLEMEDSEFSLTSTPSDRETTRARTRSRSVSQRRNRNRSYSRSKGSKGRKAGRSRGRYARRR